MKPGDGAISLDEQADNVVVWMWRLIEDERLVESVVRTYCECCRVARTNMPDRFDERGLDDSDQLRLFFELICFATHQAVVLAPRYLAAEPGSVQEMASVDAFSKRLVVHLQNYCRTAGVPAQREIIVTTLHPKVEFGLGASLDPLDRLVMYYESDARQFGAAVEVFAKKLAMSCDPHNYPLFAPAFATYGETMLYAAASALAGVLGTPSGA